MSIYPGQKAALPLIHPKYIKRGDKVDLWDVVIENGPVKSEFTVILAREALARDAERWKLDLPKGTKPGPLQDEADRLAAEQEGAAAETAAADPVYGRRSTK